jgi:biopolymer transport protein ExbB/TolQ
MVKIFAGLQTFLFVLSSLLIYPVVAGLVILVFWVMFYGGIMLREYIERKRGIHFTVNEFITVLDRLVKTEKATELLDIQIEKHLQETEFLLLRSLDRIKFIVRIGPALGLMGTLIPMGIALNALAKGDMPQMAGNMVTAFTTTVVGLGCGVAAYIMSLIKERWVRIDILEMETFAEIMLRRLRDEILEKEKNNL